MADIQADIPQSIINELDVIAHATYQGRPSSRKSHHELAFDKLRGSAEQVVAILTQNPRPNRDMRENLQAQFDTMKENADLYCRLTEGTETVLAAFSRAWSAWELYRQDG